MEKIMQLRSIIQFFLIINSLNSNINGMCFSKCISKIVPLDEVAQRQEFERRLEIIRLENQRLERIANQRIARRATHRQEHAQLVAGAAQRAAIKKAKIDELHDLKMQELIRNALNNSHLSGFEKAIELDYFSKFIKSEEKRSAIKLQTRALYYPAMPKLEI